MRPRYYFVTLTNHIDHSAVNLADNEYTTSKIPCEYYTYIRNYGFTNLYSTS